MKEYRLEVEIAQRALSDLGWGNSISGEGGIRTHGGDKLHNGFRDRPIRPLWHLSVFKLFSTPR